MINFFFQNTEITNVTPHIYSYVYLGLIPPLICVSLLAYMFYRMYKEGGFNGLLLAIISVAIGIIITFGFIYYVTSAWPSSNFG